MGKKRKGSHARKGEKAREKRAEKASKVQHETYGPMEGAAEWEHLPRAHLEQTCRTIYHMLGIRNMVIADLRDHLTTEHKLALGEPRPRA